MTQPEHREEPAPALPVVAGLLASGGRLLISRRLGNDPHGKVWEFPGGKVAPGETLDAALRRELQEELGIAVEVGELVETVEHSYSWRRVRLSFFRCRILTGEARGLEGQSLAWVKPADLTRYEFPEADASLLARLPALVRAWEREAEAQGAD